MIAGCSSNDSILNSNEPETGALLRTGVDFFSDVSDSSGIEIRGEGDQTTIFATVKTTGIHRGPEDCLYLESEDGKRFEPLFRDRAIDLKVGSMIQATGWIVGPGIPECDIPLTLLIKELRILDNQSTEPENEPENILLEGYYFNNADSPEFGNCQYLETDSGKKVSLVFKAKDPVIENKSQLEVYGFIDPDYNAGCDTGPAFIVLEFKLIEQPDKLQSLRGIYRITVKGCPYLELESAEDPTKDKRNVELDFGSDDLFKIDDGSWVEVSGYYSVLNISNCEIGPLFSVLDYQLLADSTPGEGKDKS